MKKREIDYSTWVKPKLRDSERFMVGVGMVPQTLFQCTECKEWNAYGCGGGEMVWDQFGRCEHCWDADSITE